MNAPAYAALGSVAWVIPPLHQLSTWILPELVKFELVYPKVVENMFAFESDILKMEKGREKAIKKKRGKTSKIVLLSP